MFIKEFFTPAMACSRISIGSYVRKGNILLESELREWMRSHGFPDNDWNLNIA